MHPAHNMTRQPLEDRLRYRGQCMRGWLVIHPTERPRVIIGGPNGTDVGDVDSKLVVHNSTDYLSPYLRLKASFRMNGQEDPKEHNVYFDLGFDAVESLRRLSGVEESEEKDRIRSELVERLPTGQKKQAGGWVLRVRYPCESVRRVGFEEALSRATPAQEAVLMGLAQLMLVGEFHVYVRAVPGFRRMLKRWEEFAERRGRDAAPSHDICTKDIHPRL